MQKLLTINRILIPALLVMVVAFPAIAQRTMTPEDIAAIQNVGFTQISPSGAFVAYTLVVPADPKVENRAASTHLYVYDVAAQSSLVLVTEGSIGNIAFRPEVGTITFTSRRQGDSTTSLYEI